MESLNDLLWNEEQIQKTLEEEIIHADIQIACITNSCGGLYVLCPVPLLVGTCGGI